MKRVLLLFVAMMVSVAGFAQLEVKPDSFKEIPGFVNQNPEIYDDDNNVLYAVIKVRTENLNDKQRHQLLFQGNAVTFIELEYHQDEIWVYLSSIPATYLKISHPDFGSTEFNLPFDLEPQKGYEMVLVNKVTTTTLGMGSLTIITKPEDGATITLNGKVLDQQTPYTNDMIAAGKYRINVSKERYLSVIKTVNVKEGESLTVEIDLPPISGHIKITTEPSGALVYIDGKEFGVTPLDKNDLIIGQHELHLVKQGFKTQTKQFVLDEEKVLEFNEVLDVLPEGAVNGGFSVSDNKTIYFSKGNLQYQASTKTWRFADKQWDMVGDGNNKMSPTYSGWIDQFGWGTGNEPVIFAEYATRLDYAKFVDWGINAVSNGGDKADMWRTLSKDEWRYICDERNTKSGMRYTVARIDNIVGVILFPDLWIKETYEFSRVNDFKGERARQIVKGERAKQISASEWMTIFEPQGAVFLPMRLYDGEHSIYFWGGYWSNTQENDRGGAFDNSLNPRGRSDRLYVRVVYDEEHVPSVENEKASDLKKEPGGCPEGAINGVFSVSSREKVYFSKGNLQYKPATMKWYFAENQYDIIGGGGANNDCPGSRDLFRWGTGKDPMKVVNDANEYATFNDWGDNVIENGGKKTNKWRTLTIYEWDYVLKERVTTSGIRYAKACVNGVNGLILLPDSWDKKTFKLKKTNNNEAKFADNKISAEVWTNVLEANGAVFLPAGGWTKYEYNKLYKYYQHLFRGVNEEVTYWSSTSYDKDKTDAYIFDLEFRINSKHHGESVRLVCPVE